MRIKRGTTHVKRRRTLKSKAKGFRGGRKTKARLAKTAVVKAGAYAYRDRRVKKREFRKLWQVQINAAAREHELNYSTFMKALKAAKVEINRKMLAQLAQEDPKVFAEIVKQVRTNV